MKLPVLVVLLSLAAASGHAEDPLNGGTPTDLHPDVSAYAAAGSQRGATLGSPNARTPAADAGRPAAASGGETSKTILSNWAKDCGAIDDFMKRKEGKSPKRGIGIAPSGGNAGTVIGNLGSLWYYTWGTAPVTETNVEFTPMIYDNDPTKIESNFNDLRRLKPLHVLGYNEPDLSQKPDPEDDTWDKSYAPRLPPGITAVTPASSSVNPWYEQFVGGARARPFKNVAIHLFEEVRSPDIAEVAAAVADFEHKLDAVKQSGKPVWVTEFGLITPGAANVNSLQFTQEQAACFMAQVIPYLEKDKAFERYAWFSPVPDVNSQMYPTRADSLWNRDGSLTPLGELYSQ